MTAQSAQAADAEALPTLYVAGPMTGYPDFNYPAFNDAAASLRARGFNVLNPVDAEQHNPTPGTPQAWDWYMRHALRMVLESSGVALLDGWRDSRGAVLEVTVAKALRLDVRPLDAWLTSTPQAAPLTPIEAKVQQALERLEREAQHSWRRDRYGQLLEGLGCILTGRKSSWSPEGGWPLP